MKFPPIPKPKIHLESPPADAAKRLTASKRIQDVANALEVHPGHLMYWLYQRPGHGGYREVMIPKKSGGERRLLIPPAPIAILQKKLRPILDVIYQPKDCAAGFIAGRSVVYGARRHRKRARWILNFDLSNFYGRICFVRVLGLFRSLGMGHRAAAVLAHLVTCNDMLPQGAATSPVISNMIARSLDNKLLAVARQFRLTYTRYADDISLSTTQNLFPEKLAVRVGTGLVPANVELQPRLLDTVSRAGFEVNPAKTRLYSKHVRQEITGLTVNEFVNVKRTFLRQIRAMIHAAEKHGLKNAGREYITEYAPSHRIGPEALQKSDFDPGAYFLHVIYGKLAFVRMVRGTSDRCYVNLCLKMLKIDPLPPRQVREIKAMHEQFDVFICHASEDKRNVVCPLVEALKEAEVLPFVDNEYIAWGDSFVEKINHALSRAKIVVVVLSRNSLGKAWPQKEVNSALAREVEGRVKILPLIVGSNEEAGEMLAEIPLLAGKLYRRWADNAVELAAQIKHQLAGAQ